MTTARSQGLAQFISQQHEYSLVNRGIEAEMVPAAQAVGICILPFYPLASGMLTGKYAKDAEMPKGSRMQRAER